MTRSSRPWLVAAAAALTLTGCQVLAEFLKVSKVGEGAFLQPTLKFKSAEVAELSLTGALLTTRWELENQNALGLDLASLDYALDVEGVQVLSGKPPQGLKVPAQGKAELVFPAQVQFAALAPVLMTFLTKDVAKYQVRGTVGVQTPIGLVSLPLAYASEFAVPKVPAVQLQNPKVTALTLTGATVEFPLVVTNKNTFPLPIQQVGGALAIAGTSVGSLSTGSLGALESQGTRTVSMPLRLDFLQVGLAVARIVQGGTANVQFNAQVESGEAKLPVNLSQSLTFLR